jgi:cytochrome c oxidase assembly protein subunit 16
MVRNEDKVDVASWGDFIFDALLLAMAAFDSRPLNSTPLNNKLRKNPLLFGVPFVIIMVVASYALVPFAQTKYELQDRKISKVRPRTSVPSTKEYRN